MTAREQMLLMNIRQQIIQHQAATATQIPIQQHQEITAVQPLMNGITDSTAENIPQEATATIIIPVLIPQAPTHQAITDTAVSRITVIAQTQTTVITITTEQTEHMDRIPAEHTAMETIKTITSSRQDITTIPM